MGYSNTFKAYCLYDEVNKKFVVSRDVIFLETNINDKSIERKFESMERFSHLNTYYACDNEIPNLEGGISILDWDQSLESHLLAPSPPQRISCHFIIIGGSII